MSTEGARCDVCDLYAGCGAQGERIKDCPLESNREPTTRQLLDLIVAMQRGINREFAGLRMDILHHRHEPERDNSG